MEKKVKLNISEKIERLKDGRSQTWIVNQMNKRGCKITEVRFSRKKKEFMDFKEKELQALRDIFNTDIF